MSSNWSLFFISFLAALSGYLLLAFKGFNQTITANHRWRLLSQLRSLPVFDQIIIVGVITGVMGAIGISIFRFATEKPINNDPLLWAFGWIGGAIVAGIIRQFGNPK